MRGIVEKLHLERGDAPKIAINICIRVSKLILFQGCSVIFSFTLPVQIFFVSFSCSHSLPFITNVYEACEGFFLNGAR